MFVTRSNRERFTRRRGGAEKTNRLRRSHVDLPSDLVIECDRACAAGDYTTRVAGDEADFAAGDDSEGCEAIDAREGFRRDVGDRCGRPDRQFGYATDQRLDARRVDAATLAGRNGLAVRARR